ncbi:uncharacterized protein EV154DRAFT_566746 [Mucor mucedo]|uniref:uncharacterized protein n=1 Tax=Mucor mucedo TaxID=29922 RepID=UPI0022202D50|nr:uncharacterized protein EV154DRAFT_566746 [Mucor mucedo]KAI7888059.1 hypothetical protein EV154DRAFT_566746 [Mucor mucedo]
MNSTNTNDNTTYQGFRPRLIEFHGHEGEDFRHFKNTLDTFFSITGINSNIRRLTILISQLRRSAATFLSRLMKQNVSEEAMKYEDAMDLLQSKYITPELVQRYEIAFNDMAQGTNASPQIFLSRLYEAAELAEIEDDNMIHSRFRAGLIRDIRIFCIQSSSRTFDDWVTHADGWWNANKPIGVSLIENPFLPEVDNRNTSVWEQKVSNNVSGKMGSNERNRKVSFGETKSVNSNGSIATHDVVNYEPAIEQITAQLRSLKLHQMEQLKTIETNLNSNQTTERSSAMTEMDIINIIKRTIKEELKNSSKGASSANVPGSNGHVTQAQFTPNNNYPSYQHDNSRYGKGGCDNNDRKDYANYNYPRNNNYNNNNNNSNPNNNNYNNNYQNRRSYPNQDSYNSYNSNYRRNSYGENANGNASQEVKKVPYDNTNNSNENQHVSRRNDNETQNQPKN